MTVCIAAAYTEADNSRGVVLCSDALISSYLGKAQTMLKVKRLAPKWAAMVSGEDSEILGLMTILKKAATHRSAELKLAREKLQTEGSPLAKFDNMDEGEITKIVRDSLTQRKNEKADELVRGRYGISYSDFLGMGKEKFPPDEFRRDFIEIGALELGAEFIIAGFANGFPFLLEADTFGKTKARDDFAVVGSGASLAQSVMMHRAHTDVHTYEETLYCVYEAKKYSEGQPNVGENTNIFTMRSDGSMSMLKPEGHNWLRERFAEFGPRKIPDAIPCPDKAAFNEFK